MKRLSATEVKRRPPLTPRAIIRQIYIHKSRLGGLKHKRRSLLLHRFICDSHSKAEILTKALNFHIVSPPTLFAYSNLVVPLLNLFIGVARIYDSLYINSLYFTQA